MMKRRDFLRIATGGSILSLLPRGGVFAEGKSSSSRPNVLLLLADQHNANVAGFAGHPDVRTPSLDRLAAAGMRFNRAYCPDGVCCPSRTALMTGQYPRTFGELLNEPDDAPVLKSLTPLQTLFRRAGYYTFTAGKRHLLRPLDVDWDYSAGHLETETYDTLNYWAWIKSQGLLEKLQFDWSTEWNKRFGGNGSYGPLCSRISVLPPEATMEAFTEWQTTKFLESDRAKQQPFFAWSTFYRPHQPYTPQQKYVDRIDFKSIHLPSTLWQKAEELPPWLCQWRHNTALPWNLGSADEALYRQYLGYYHALVEEVDDHIGRILDVLERRGLAENTIVIYTSDHGDFVGNHGLIEKGIFGHNFYEEILRVPLVVRWPGKISAGTKREDLTELVDLYPTLLNLCDIEPPKDRRPVGLNLADTLLHQNATNRKYVVSENWSQATVITDTMKYGQWLNALKPESDFRSWGNMLTERSSDPHELKNLFRDPVHAAALTDLQGYLKEWTSRIDDSGRRTIFAEAKREYTVV